MTIEGEKRRAVEFVAELRELADLVERTKVGVVNYYIGAKTRLADGGFGVVNVSGGSPFDEEKKT